MDNVGYESIMIEESDWLAMANQNGEGPLLFDRLVLSRE